MKLLNFHESSSLQSFTFNFHYSHFFSNILYYFFKNFNFFLYVTVVLIIFVKYFIRGNNVKCFNQLILFLLFSFSFHFNLRKLDSGFAQFFGTSSFCKPRYSSVYNYSIHFINIFKKLMNNKFNFTA